MSTKNVNPKKQVSLPRTFATSVRHAIEGTHAIMSFGGLSTWFHQLTTKLHWMGLMFVLQACTARLNTIEGVDDTRTNESTSGSSETIPLASALTTEGSVPLGSSEPSTSAGPSVEHDGGTLAPGEDGSVSGHLQLLASSPVAGETGVAVNARLRFTFDKPVTIGAGVVQLLTRAGDSALSADVSDVDSVTVDGQQVSVTLGDMAYATWYSVYIDPGAFVGVDGSSFEGLDGSELAFSTVAPEPLVLSYVSPRSTQKAPIDTGLTLVFNLPVGPAPEGGYLSLFAEGVDEPLQRLQVSDFNSVQFLDSQVDVTLDAPLDYASQYFVLLESDAIASIQGARFAGIDDPSRFAFTTVDAPRLTVVESAPVEVGVARDDVAPNSRFVFTFSEDILPGEGTFAVHAAADNSVVAQVGIPTPAAGEVTIQGHTLTVALPENLDGQTTFYATLDAGTVKGLYGAVFDGIVGSDQLVFTTSANALPDVQLTATTPDNGASNVSVTTPIQLTFDVPVVVGPGTISLHDTSTQATIASVDLGSAAVVITGTQLTWTLEQILPGSTEIEIHLSPGAVVGTSGAQFPGVAAGAVAFTTENSFGLVQVSPLGIDVSGGADLVLTFSDDAEVGTGSITVWDGNQMVETVTLPDARVTVSGKVATVDLDNILAGGREFEVRVDGGAFVESDGGGGMLPIGPGDWTFTTDSVTPPANLGTGLVLWLDASYASSVKGSGSVALWADRSGQYRNVAQSASASRPALATAAINGLNAIAFDGSNDVFRASELLSLSNLEGFVVWQSSVAPSTNSQRTIISNDANFEVNHGHPFGASTANSLTICVGDECPSEQWYLAQFLPAPVANRTYLWNFGYNSIDTSMFARSNVGATKVQTGPTAPPVEPTVPLTVGGESSNCTSNCYFQGQIAEIVLYSTQLTSQQRLDVSEYLYDKWMAAPGSCSSGEQQGPNGNCYYYSSANATWASARTACKARGSGWDLAEVRNELDQRFLTTKVLPTDKEVWLGAQDAEPNDTWTWLSDGLVFWTGKTAGAPADGSLTYWEPDQPNDGDAVPHCLRCRYRNAAWGWSDGDCGGSLPYVCQGPPR